MDDQEINQAPVTLDVNPGGGSTGDKPSTLRPPTPRIRRVLLSAIPFALLVVVILSFLAWRVSRPVEEADLTSVEQTYDISLPDDLELNKPDFPIESSEQVVVNGDLQANGSVIIVGSEAPENPVPGQLYYDNSTNQMLFYNGSSYISLDPPDEGDLLPQDLSVSATPTFANITISGVIPVGSGGTGVTSLAANGVLYGSGTGNIQVTSAPTAGQILIGDSNGVPVFASVGGDLTISSTGTASLAQNTVGSAELIATGVSTGTYGSGAAIAQLTIDADGRVTSITEIPVAIGAGDILQNGNSFSAAMTIGTNDNFDLNLETNGSTRLTVDNAGDVDIANNLIVQDRLQVGTSNSIDQCTGLGLFDCTVGFELYVASTESTDQTYGILNNTIITSAAENTANNYGVATYMTLQGTQDYSGVNVGTLGQIFSNTSGTSTAIAGVQGQAGVVAGTATSAYGVHGSVLQLTAGSIASAYSLYAGANAGTITDSYGLFIEDQTAGSGSNYGAVIAGADTYALWVGSGADNTDAANGITFGATAGTSTNLYRSGDNLLKTDDQFVVQTTTDSTTGFQVLDSNGGTSVLSVDTVGEYVGIGNDSPNRKLQVGGSTTVVGTGLVGISGEIDPDGTTTVEGTAGTAFTTELYVGDRLAINGEYRVITSITDDDTLIVSQAFTDTANDTTPEVLPAVFSARNALGGLDFNVDSGGTYASKLTVGDINEPSNCFTIIGDIACDANLEVVNGGAGGSDLYGIYNYAYRLGLGTDTDDSFGSYNTLVLGNTADYEGAVNAAVYGYVSHPGSGTTTTISALQADVSVSGGTVTTAHGLLVESASASGTLTNNYGVLIESQIVGTNSYGLAIAGAGTYALWVGSGADNTDAANGITFGATTGTAANLYRGGDNILKTDDYIEAPILTLGTADDFDDCQVGVSVVTCTRAQQNWIQTDETTTNSINTNLTTLVGTTGPNSAENMGIRNTFIAGDFGVDDFTGSNAGITSNAFSYSGGTVSNLFGVEGAVDAAWTGDVTNALALKGQIRVSNASATIDNGKGLEISTPTTTGTLTNYYGIDVQNGGGVTSYGIRVQDQAGGTSNDYGIAIAGADTYALWVGSGADNTDAANGITFGVSGDTNLYRSAANTLATDDNLVVSQKGAIGANASITADAILNVAQDTTATSGFDYGTRSQLSVNPGGASTGIHVGVAGSAISESGNANDITTLIGVSGSARTDGTGTVTNASGFYSLSYSSQGDITNLAGFDSDAYVTNATSVTNAYGLNASIIMTSSGDLTNGYGLYVQPSVDGGAGEITSNYGAFIADQNAGVDNYGVVVEGAGTYALWVGSGADNTDAANGITMGATSGTSVNLYRSADNVLSTDDDFTSSRLAINASAFGTDERIRVNTPTTADNDTAGSISTGAIDQHGLIIQGVAGQTANLQEWQSSTGTALAYVRADGTIDARGGATSGVAANVVPNGANVYGILGIATASATKPVAEFRGGASQSAVPIVSVQQGSSQTSDLMQWWDSSGNLELAVAVGGSLEWADSAGGAADTNLYRSSANLLATDDSLSIGADIFITAALNLGVQNYSVADSGDGSPAADTLTPTSSYVEVTCNDVDGCNITMGEGSASEGDTLFIVNIGANTANFADTAAVSELSGAFAAGQYDSISMIYIGDRWVETARSDN